MTRATEDSIQEARKKRRELHAAGIKGINRYKGSTSGSGYIRRTSSARSPYKGSSYSS